MIVLEYLLQGRERERVRVRVSTCITLGKGRNEQYYCMIGCGL